MSSFVHRWSWRRGRWLAGAGIVSLGLVLPARAIEMFTYFGDGSRIGLPSLEVPVQAYPGIPLRSDRIRARSRAQQARRAAEAAAREPRPAGGSAATGTPAARPASDGYPGIPGGGITIRPMTPQPLSARQGMPAGRSLGQPPAHTAFPIAPSATASPAPAQGGTDWSTIRSGTPAPPGGSGLAPPAVPPARTTQPQPAVRQAQPEAVPLPGFTQPVFPGPGYGAPRSPAGR